MGAEGSVYQPGGELAIVVNAHANLLIIMLILPEGLTFILKRGMQLSSAPL